MKKALILALILTMLSACSYKPKTDILPTSSPAPTQKLQAKDDSEVSLSFVAVGDNLIHNTIYMEAAKRTGGKGFDFLPDYEPVSDRIKSADIAFINQETPLGGTELGLSSYPLFNSPQELGDDLITLGFDVVSQANNHIFDKGEAGIRNTIAYWKSKPAIVLLGINDGTLPAVSYIEKNNVKIAFLSYAYDTNGINLPEGSKYSVNKMDKDKITKDVWEARENADIVIVSMHWGTEYLMSANDLQKDFASLLAALNVDLVIGHHPHVIEPMDTLKRTDGKDMVIAYSLGNFISSQNKAESMLGGMLSVKFSGTKSDVETKVLFIPLITHYEGSYKNTKVYPFYSYTAKLSAIHGCKNFDSRFSYSFIDGLINKTIDAKYLPSR